MAARNVLQPGIRPAISTCVTRQFFSVKDFTVYKFSKLLGSRVVSVLSSEVTPLSGHFRFVDDVISRATSGSANPNRQP